MSHVMGKGRYARETYPGKSGGEFPAPGAFRFYGGDTLASVPVTVFGATRNSNSWIDFLQEDLLEGGALTVLGTGVTIGRFSAKRVITGAMGPIIGDDPVSYELMRSIDDGANWTTLGALSYLPNESGDKTIVLSASVPAGSLLAVRATYPANYDPQGQEEVVLFEAR